MVKPRYDSAVLLKNTRNIAIFDPRNNAFPRRRESRKYLSELYSKFLYNCLF
ncbi:hypothetical protein [Rickettsia endosymbiont of Orchestes rusci]|uniref:hypothetical protein n=1 Tax=Rickettsia endosymbiont of Orchestes rusci TaxID=3066250 RepID=UPI00313CC482